jgi:hypothetical protein
MHAEFASFSAFAYAAFASNFNATSLSFFMLENLLIFSFSIDKHLIKFYLFCTKYDFFARSKTFHLLKSKNVDEYNIICSVASYIFIDKHIDITSDRIHIVKKIAPKPQMD